MDEHPTDSKVIVILGMHRSGTSCLAGSLKEAGLYLGNVNDAADHNAKGNHENRAIMDLNEAVLLANGGSWDSPPKSVTWNSEHKTRRDELIATYPTDRTWGFKDPRTLLTLPGWLEVLPHVCFIGTFRHPVAVCASLIARNKFSKDRCMQLWFTYNRLLMRYQREFGFQLVCFDWSPRRYYEKLGQVGRNIGFSEPKHGFTFLESSLRRNKAPRDEKLPDSIFKLYRTLQEISG